MDTCEGAAGPRPVNGVFSPGRTEYATVDDVNGGFCGVNIDRPGIWWWVEGTGDIIKVSTCDKKTSIKVKISVFTGSCNDLKCVRGGAEPDYECSDCKKENEIGEWESYSTALTFHSKLGADYYILVQQESLYRRGTIWLNFQTPIIPQNDNCVDAIGPVPRDMTRIDATSVFGTISQEDDYCGGERVPSLYPGTWFQIMGTGKEVTVMACGALNTDGYAFSVYNGANCDSLECVSGSYKVNVVDRNRCNFNGEIRPMTKYTFETVDRSRYYVYLHFAQTRADKPTTDFRFFADDGTAGKGSSSGAHVILFQEGTTIDIGDRDRGNSDGNGKSSSNIVRFQSRFSLFVLIVS